MQFLNKINKKFILIFLVFVVVFSTLIFGVNYLLQNKPSEDLNKEETQTPTENIEEIVDINVTEPANVCLIEFEVKETPKNTDSTIEKQFRNLNNENLPATYLIKSGEKLVVFTQVVNTGNTPLTDLITKDPLTDEFSNSGAKNLDQLVFSEFLNNPNNLCRYDTTFKFIECQLGTLNPQAIFEYSFIVTAKSDLINNSDIFNVARLNSVKNSILKYSSDSLKTPVKTEATHLICKDEACVSTSGSGDNDCSNDDDCVYSTCENRACIEKTCDSGDCDDDCDTDRDCREETHLECVSDTCKRVDGEGKNTCIDNTDCYSTHLTCKNASCVSVSGKGTNSCSSDNDCRLSPVVYSVPSTGVPFSPAMIFIIYLPSLFFATSLLLRILISRK
ncbi:hypothetical protein KA001_01315 [Patescibacteria group bacterium]|nr:hypothetical protein [Patescibacteria group bacterium]